MRAVFPAIFTSCILTVFCLRAQKTAVSVHTLPGISQNYNAFIYKDSYGFVWTSSLDGLNCSNGISTRVFVPDPNDPQSIVGRNIQSTFFEDQNGDIWFGTEKALNCYRRWSGKFDHFQLVQGDTITAGTGHHVFYLERNRFLWLTAGDSLLRFDTRNNRRMPEAYFVYAPRFGVDADPQGRVERLYACFWLIGPGMEQMNFLPDGSLVSRDTFFSGQGQTGQEKLTIYQAEVITDNLVWFATNGGLVAFNPEHPDAYQVFPPTAAEPGVRGICIKDQRSLLVLTSRGRILTFNLQPSGKNEYQPLEGEFPDNIITLYLDRDGILWYPMQGEGVFFGRLAERQFRQPLEKLVNAQEGIISLLENRKKKIYAASPFGKTFVFDRQGNLENRLQLPRYPRFFQSRNGFVWLISSEGLARLDEHNKLDKILPALDRVFHEVIELQDKLLISTNANALLYSPGGHTVETIIDLPDNTIALSLDPQGNLWTGDSERLLVWKLENGIKPVQPRPIGPGALVNCILVDTTRNFLWAGTSQGLLRVDLTTLKDSLIDTSTGLPNQYIYSIVQDRHQNLWLSTNKGIVKYIPEGQAPYRFKLYTTRNGLSTNEFSRNAGIMSSNGLIWFGSQRGLDVFDPEAVRDIGKAPDLAIIGLKIHDKEWVGDSSIQQVKKIILPYNQNTLRFELAALEYTDPEMNRFMVQLEEAESQWNDLGTQNYVTYPNLQPGTYRFKFKACNADGIWQNPKVLEIIIRPHYTQTWQFRTLVAILALALIGFITALYYRYQLREKQLQLEKQQHEAERKQLLLENELALQRERNRIADEMHDELGGGLSTIRLASERAKKMKTADDLKNVLNRVSEIAIGLVGNMRGIIWAMDTQNDSLDSLLSYLRQYAGSFLDDNALDAKIVLPDKPPERVLSGQFRHNVMLTVKESLNNVVKHAQATRVNLEVKIGVSLTIRISDNGVGFDPKARARSGKGLRSMSKRMKSLNGTIHWRPNTPAPGTTAELDIPLPGAG